MPDIAYLHHFGDGADGVFDRHGRVEPRRAIDVDIFGAESLQRVGQKVLHRRRPAVISRKGADGAAQRADFDADLHFVAIASAAAWRGAMPSPRSAGP